MSRAEARETPARQVHALTVPLPDLDGAACASGELLPPSAWTGGGTRADQLLARAICRGACPVLQVCREWALSSRAVPGIAGGLSELERVVIRRNRRKDRTPPPALPWPKRQTSDALERPERSRAGEARSQTGI